MLADLQAAFHQGLIGGDSAAAEAFILAADRNEADARFQIYRNNVLTSLTGVLAAAFPVVHRLVGASFFRAASRRFISQQPPKRPQLMHYGAEFPAYLEVLPEAQPLAYLADVARLEWARMEAYFAADAEPINPNALASLPPEAVTALRFVAHPASRLVVSKHPIQQIWQANQASNIKVPRVNLDDPGETVLITRPEAHVLQSEITSADAMLFQTLSNGKPLETAAYAALEIDANFDLQMALAAHFSRGSFSETVLTTQSNQEREGSHER